MKSLKKAPGRPGEGRRNDMIIANDIRTHALYGVWIVQSA
jgi:hypothetical protein